jgi:chemotaxis protein histidine kinase CheA
MVDKIPDLQEILAQMNEKFIETAAEKISRLNEILSDFSKGINTPELYEEFFREIHSLKGLGGTFQMPLVTKVCHAFEDYIEGYTSLNEAQISDSFIFVDRLNDLIESNDANDDSLGSVWLVGLPQKGEIEEVKETTKTKFMIISSDPDLIDELSSMLSKDEFEVSSSLSAFKGYRMAVLLQPDIILVSERLEEMSGSELIRSLSGMLALKNSRFAMVCPDRRKALSEGLQSVTLLSEKNVDKDVLNFLALVMTN